MIGFLIRKTLYDLWDNMFRIVVLNIGFLAVTMIPVFLPQLAGKLFNSISLQMIISGFGILCCSIYLAAAALCVNKISDYGVFSFRDFLHSFKTAWRLGLVMGLFIFLIFLVVSIIIPFYAFQMKSAAGLIIAAFIFWLGVFALLSFQFYFAAYSRLGKKVFKSVKKCMIISLDNSFFSVFLILHNIVVLVISVVFVFMFPGPAGVLLYIDEALRLRLLKYDWLEANPGANRRKIPWDELLIDDRERTGIRTFRNFIFPWKD